MSTKPTQVPLWATDATYTGGVEAGTDTKTEPDGARKAEGWEPAAKPPAQEFNWWWNLVGLWAQYLNDGALEGNHSIDGDLDVTGAADVTGNLDVGGTTTAVDLVLSGEDYHGDREVTVCPTSDTVVGTYASAINASAIRHVLSAGDFVAFDIGALASLRKGDRVKSIKIVTTSGDDATVELYDQTGATATLRAFTQTGEFDVIGGVEIEPDVPAALTQGQTLVMWITAGGSAVNIWTFTIT